MTLNFLKTVLIQEVDSKFVVYYETPLCDYKYE